MDSVPGRGLDLVIYNVLGCYGGQVLRVHSQTPILPPTRKTSDPPETAAGLLRTLFNFTEDINPAALCQVVLMRGDGGPTFSARPTSACDTVRSPAQNYQERWASWSGMWSVSLA